MSIIPRELARSIVNEIGQEIDYHINFMDENGIMIASTNPEREGILHTGAKKLLDENLDELIIDEDGVTSLIKTGTNLPITYQGVTVGVIGITGAEEDVRKYGKIVKKMTEILMEEKMRTQTKFYERRIIYRFVEEWLQKKDALLDKDFQLRGQNIGIDITLPRRCISFQYKNTEFLVMSLDGQNKINEMNQVLRDYIHRLHGSVYLHQSVLHHAFVPPMKDEDIIAFAQKIQDRIRRDFKEEVVCGYDGHVEGSNEPWVIKREADSALRSAHAHAKSLVGFDELLVELVIHDISAPSANRYLGKLFAGVDEGDLAVFYDLIDAYFACEGSIQEISDRLFIHKNTTQYRILKLKEATGYDIRKPSEALIFYLAKQCHIWSN